MSEKKKCELCKEHVATQECACGKHTCEECGRTVATQAQAGTTLNARVDKWECLECEFGHG